MASNRAFYRFLRWRAPRRELHGVAAWAPWLSRHDQDSAFQRVADAIALVKQYSPGRYARLRRSFTGIIIYGTSSGSASYITSSRLCRLWETYVLSPDVSTASIASALVHEATHGWLGDRGIGYSEPIRHRVERACVRAEMLFCRRVPSALAELQRCEQQLLTLQPEQFTDTAFVAGAERELRELGCPAWLVNAVIWLANRRRRITAVRADAQKAARRST